MASSDFITTGGGELFIKPIVGGTKQAMMPFGTTDGVTLSTEVESIEHKNTEGAVAVTDKKVAKSRSAMLNFTTAEISPDILSRAFLGEKATISQEAGVDVAQTITSASFANVYDLGVVKITGLEVKDSADTVTYVNGTDYTYDKNTGYLQFIEGGAISEDDEIHLTINYDAYEKTNIAALKGDELEAELVFVSSPQSGKKYRYTFKKVSISATGDFALKSEEFVTISFEGEALVDSTVSDPVLSDYFDIELLPND